MGYLSRAVEIFKSDGVLGLFNGFRRFLYFRIPNRRFPLQLYYLFRGKILRRSSSGWYLWTLWRRDKFYFPELQSHDRHSDRYVNNLEDTYFSDEDIQIEKGDIVFDVGAYIGVTSILAAQKAERVFAIEPSPRVHFSLERNTEDYDNIEVVKCAVSDESSEKDLQFGRTISDDSLITPDDGGSGETITVPVKTIEQLVEELEVSNIDFLKIEAEGLEPEVVKGALDAPVKKIAVAGNDERYGETTYQEVVDLLREAGFAVNENSADLEYNMVYGIREEE